MRDLGMKACLVGASGAYGMTLSLAIIGAIAMINGNAPAFWPLFAGAVSGAVGGALVLAFANWMHDCLEREPVSRARETDVPAGED